MKLPLSIAKKLQLLCQGEILPGSALKHESVKLMQENGVLQMQLKGRSQKRYYLKNEQALSSFLQNHFGINSLDDYVAVLENDTANRAEAIQASSDSKLKHTRSFKGFMVNAISAINGKLNNQEIIISPTEGAFTFIYDFDAFWVPKDVVIVGVENAENFRYIQQQKALFQAEKCLFASRYPQNRDLIQWLCSIPNQYLHFGDFDFAGLNIYANEFKKHLGDRATFYVPDNIEKLLEKHGNRELYHKQQLHSSTRAVEEQSVVKLIKLIEKHKKGLEQEVLIGNNI
jgi:hypothetical protein